jgi:type I restriction enzyme S subunit
LGEVITLKRGYDLPTRERVDGSIPVVSSSGVTGTHTEAKVKGPGVVTGRYGTLGEVFFIEQNFWPLNTTLYVKDFKGNDRRFIRYFLQSLPLASQNAAGAVPGVNRNHLHKLNVKVPPLPVQRQIAGVLSAYDDLIENNARRIALLEELAQLLYREWFVRFRFPGHEALERVEALPQEGSVSPVTGPIPAGWKIEPLKEVCRLILGVSPKSKYYNEYGEGLPFHQGVSDFGEIYPVTRRYCTQRKRVAQEDDILFSVRAPVGRINLADRTIVIGRGLHAIRSKSGHQFFILLQLLEKFAEEDQVGSGTIFKSVTKKDMQGIQFLIPPADLRDRFEDIVTPMYAEIKNLTKKNALLRTTRDLLLPRLVSGEVDVSEVAL